MNITKSALYQSIASSFVYDITLHINHFWRSFVINTASITANAHNRPQLQLVMCSVNPNITGILYQRLGTQQSELEARIAFDLRQYLESNAAYYSGYIADIGGGTLDQMRVEISLTDSSAVASGGGGSESSLPSLYFLIGLTIAIIIFCICNAILVVIYCKFSRKIKNMKRMTFSMKRRGHRKNVSAQQIIQPNDGNVVGDNGNNHNGNNSGVMMAQMNDGNINMAAFAFVFLILFIISNDDPIKTLTFI